MTLELFNQIMKENGIPDNAELMSDSGWDCKETSMMAYSTIFSTITFPSTDESCSHPIW